MAELDVVVRVATGALFVTLALLVLRAAPRARTAWLFLLLALGACGFLARNTPIAELQPDGAAAILAAVLSGNAAIFLWWFCLSVFDDEFVPGRVELGVGAVWFAIFLVDRGVPFPAMADASGPSWALVAIATALVAHIAWRLIHGLDGDLVEGRRRARAALAATLAALLLVDLGVDMAFGFDWRPHWFAILQNAVILVVVARLFLWLARADAAALAFVAPARPPTEPAAHAAAQPGPLRARLDRLMETDRVHLDPELTFSDFAARMGAPEAEVRRLINRELGWRHFRSFLNAWRLVEARQALADPARAEEKIASIAFDSGFASLASFNRAFKLAAGQSPSDYRAAALADGAGRVERSADAGKSLETEF